MTSGQHNNHRQRMKSRFLETGCDGFQQHELLEMLLYYTIPRRNTNDIAHELIKIFGSLESVLTADCSRLKDVKYITENTVILFKLITQTAKLYSTKYSANDIFLNEIKTINKYFTTLFLGDRHEIFRVVCLDDNMKVVESKILSEGTSDCLKVNIRKLIEFIFTSKCDKIIISHNHPNGHATPSQDDINLTFKIQETLSILEITLIDHIIVSGQNIYSMRNNGMIRKG